MKKTSTLVLAALLAAGCGGGGGGGSTSTTARQVAVRGPITGFGSIVINGIHYETERAEIEIGDVGGHGQDDLAVGQIVSIAGSVDDNGRYHAERVRYASEVQGTITALDVAAGTFTAVGQDVAVSDATIFQGITGLVDLALGDRVEVSGSRDANNVVQASYVKKEGPEAESEVRGLVANLDTGLQTFTVGDLTVNYASATLRPTTLQLADGLIVEVEGQLSGGVLQARKIHQEDSFVDDQAGHEAEVEGVIREVREGGSFVVDDVVVTTGSGTRYRNGTAANLVVGARVEAEGSIASDGSLRASKVSFKAASRGRLEGLVEAVNPTAGTLTVMGVTLNVTSSTALRDKSDARVRNFSLADIRVGDYLEAAYSGSTGNLEAQRIERDDADDRSLIRGTVDSFDPSAETLSIAGVMVDASGARYQVGESANVDASTFYAAIGTGSEVKAKGVYANGVLDATEVELEAHESEHD